MKAFRINFNKEKKIIVSPTSCKTIEDVIKSGKIIIVYKI